MNKKTKGKTVTLVSCIVLVAAFIVYWTGVGNKVVQLLASFVALGTTMIISAQAIPKKVDDDALEKGLSTGKYVVVLALVYIVFAFLMIAALSLLVRDGSYRVYTDFFLNLGTLISTILAVLGSDFFK